MLKSRLTTALILTAVLAIVTLAPIWCFNIVAYVVALLAMKEMCATIKKTGHKPANWLIYISPLYLIFSRGLNVIADYQVFILYFLLLMVILISMVVFSDNKFTYIDAAMNLFSVFYIVGSVSFILFTRYLLPQAYFVWLIFVTACCTDTGAYIVGMNIGKHKLPLSISPKKSIEGVIGGILLAIFGCTVYACILQAAGVCNCPIYYFSIFGFIVSIIAQIGDLIASAIKRTAGVKDFSDLMPGHGGIIDRFDSVFLVAPFTFIFFSIL